MTLLADVCIGELRKYYGLSPLQTTSPASVGSDRYRRFQERLRAHLDQHGLGPLIAQTIFGTVPAICQAALAGRRRPAGPDPEVREFVEAFIAGTAVSDQPFYPHDLAIKCLESRLFNRFEHPAPSLELGFGDGFASSHIFKHQKLTLGSDPSLLGTLNAKQFGRHEHLMCIDATSVPFSDGSFRSVLLVNSIDHVADRRAVLREAARVLGSGGTLVLSDGSDQVPDLQPLCDIFRLLGFSQLADDAYDFYLDVGGENREWWSPARYTEELNQLGFESISVEYFMSPQLARVTYLPYQLIHAFNRYLCDEIRRNERLRESYFAFLREGIVPLLEDDRFLCTSERGGQGLFVSARKCGPYTSSSSTHRGSLLDDLVCASCRGALERVDNAYSCKNCERRYPIIEDVPLLLPVYADSHEAIVSEASSRTLVNVAARFQPDLEASCGALVEVLVRVDARPIPPTWAQLAVNKATDASYDGAWVIVGTSTYDEAGVVFFWDTSDFDPGVHRLGVNIGLANGDTRWWFEQPALLYTLLRRSDAASLLAQVRP